MQEWGLFIGILVVVYFLFPVAMGLLGELWKLVWRKKT